MRKKAVPTDLWERALKALRAARRDLREDPDGSASRSFYAATYAVEAFFLNEGRMLDSHGAVWDAVNQGLVRPGRWPGEFSDRFRLLKKRRDVGDYGGGAHVTPEGAAQAYDAALAFLRAVHAEYPDAFPLELEPRDGEES